MKPTFVTLTSLLLLSIGCSAAAVNSPGARQTRSAYAPLNETWGGGVIKYQNQGEPLVLEARREDAYRQMYTTCEGAYRIDAEGPQSDGTTVAPVAAGAAAWQKAEYRYLQFSCANPAVAQLGTGIP